MQTVKLTICVVNTGNEMFFQRTMNSLQKQTSKHFATKILSLQQFKTSKRNDYAPDMDYVMFLYSGSCLEDDAVEKLNTVLQAKTPVWLYCNEKTYSAEILEDPYGFLEKPDFDPLAFVQKVYTGEGVVFSRRCLNQMELCYEGCNFGVALKEMAIAAAMQAEPIHLKETLLLRHNKPALNALEQELLIERLQKYLSSQYENLLGIPKVGMIGLDIVPREVKSGSLTAVFLMDEGDKASETQIPVLEDTIEIVTVSGEMPYWEKCLQGAKKATTETLCFMIPEYVRCSEDNLLKLLSYWLLLNAGVVSPRIANGAEEVYVGYSLPVTRQLSITRIEQSSDHRNVDIHAIRRTAMPAWQCWMISKKLFLQVMDKVMSLPKLEEYSRDYFLLEFALRVEDLGQKNYYIGPVAVKGKKVHVNEQHKEFCSMLFRNKDAFMQDRFCATEVAGYLRQNALRNTITYFPKKMQEYDREVRKILVLTHELSLTGAPMVLSHAVHILREENVQVTVLSPMDGPLRDTFLRENVPIIIQNDMDDNEQWLGWASEFDLILVNTVVPFRQIQQLGKISTPVLWWLHDAKSGYEDYLQHVLPNTVPENVSIYSVSKYADDALKTYRPEYKSELLFYGLRDKGKEQIKTAKKIEGTAGKKVFVNVGTMIRRKGQDILVEAVRQLPESIRKQCLFLFIGKCIDQDIFQQVLKLEQDYPEEVRQIDAVPHDEIFDLYRQATAVICSSRDDPLPTFMSETMMVSGICICSENTGTASVIRHGKNAFLYEKDDPKRLAQCIQMVVKNGDMEQVRIEARKTFEQYFTLDTFRYNLLRCVEDCIDHVGKGAAK